MAADEDEDALDPGRPEVIRDVRGVLSGLQRPETLPGRQTIEPGRRYALMADRASDPNA